MATITVTNANDSGTGSLREALNQAASQAGADTIVFDQSLNGQTIVLQSRLDISDSDGVTVNGDVNGDGEIDITISGDSNQSGRSGPASIDSGDSAFLINRAGSQAYFTNIEFDGGYYAGSTSGDPGAGGVIINEGDLTIVHSVIDGAKVVGNQTSTGATGQDTAVVANRAGATVKFTDVIVDEAYVRGAVAVASYGAKGGDAALIFNSGDLNVRRIAFNGYFYGGAGVGGASPPVTNGGDAHAGVINVGAVSSGSVVGQRTAATVNVAPGAAGAASGSAAGTNFFAQGSFIASKDGGTFSGKADFSPITADDSATSYDGSASGAPIGFLGIGGDDTVVGSNYDDDISGGRGNDLLITGGGADIGGGGYGNDTVRGQGGNDRLFGDIGDDRLFGQAGNDRLTCDEGDDRAVGGGGNDTAFGDSGRDTLIGNSGRDRLFGGGQNDKLVGGGDNDRLIGGGGNDRIEGGGGNDFGAGGGGRDRLIAGVGRDTMKGDGGADTVIGGAGNDRLIGGGQNDRVVGGGGNDRLFGGSGKDVLLGGVGNDRLEGGGANDRLIAGRGSDTVVGGAGSDRFVFGPNDGVNHIRDFRNGVDKFELNGVSSFDDLDSGDGDDKGGGVIGSIFSFRGTTVILDNFNGQLDESDFIF